MSQDKLSNLYVFTKFRYFLTINSHRIILIQTNLYLSYDSSDVIKLLKTTDCNSPNKDD